MKRNTNEYLSIEQQFCESDAITCCVKKSGAILLVLVGIMAGWQADSHKILVDKFLKIL